MTFADFDNNGRVDFIVSGRYETTVLFDMYYGLCPGGEEECRPSTTGDEGDDDDTVFVSAASSSIPIF